MKIRDLQDQAIANHSVNFTATIQGSSPISGTAKTDADGKAIVQFQLPENLNSADGLLNIIVHGQVNLNGRPTWLLISKILKKGRRGR